MPGESSDCFAAWRQLPTRWHNQDCLLGYLPPVEVDGQTPAHFDDVYMLWFICQGKADLLINDTCYPVPAGSLLWTSPSLLHAHRASERIEVIWCLFSPSFVQKVWQDISPESELPYAAIFAVTKPLEATLSRLLQESTQPTVASDRLLTLLSHLALVDVLRLFLFAQQKTHYPLSTTEIPLTLSPLSDVIAQAISQFRSGCCREEVTPKLIAEQIGLSLFHFTRRFKQETGITPGHYLRELRLNQAFHLLLSTRLPLDEIAHLCGLGSTRRLSDLYHTRFGQSPTQIRHGSERTMIVRQIPAQKIVGNEQRNVL